MKAVYRIIVLALTMIYTSFGIIYKELGCRNYKMINKPHADCSGDEEFLILPDNIDKGVQELYVEVYFRSSLAINAIDTFNRFPNLSVLDIRTGKSFHVDEKLQESDTQREELRKKLFDLPNLVTLIIHYEVFNEANNSWVLPPTLKELHLHHSVFEFDVYPCTSLEKLIFTNSRLKKMPALRDPPPPLRILSLENSSDGITVDDIASFCKLQRLQLDLQVSEQDPERNCECFRLQEWITDLKMEAERNGDITFISDVSLNCSEDYSSDCWNYTLDDAWRKREKCLWSHYGIVPNWLKRSVLLILMMTIVMAIIIMSYSVHCMTERPKLSVINVKSTV